MARSEAVVGIDVSKRRLEAHVLNGHHERQVTNDRDGWRELVDWARSLGAEVAVMEASGGYERDLAKALRGAGFTVRVVDPKRVRHYAKAIGRLAKNDRIDARMIAEFGALLGGVAAVPLSAATDPKREHLAALVGARADLVDHRIGLHNQAEASPVGPARRTLQRAAAAIDRQVEALDRQIAAAIAEHAPFAALARRLATVPGVGPVTLAALIAWLPELGLTSRQAIAALAGVAPYDDDSDERHGRRCIKGGRKQLRNVLYMSALSAKSCNPLLKKHYASLLSRGKAPKLALVACIRKLLGILNAMIARQEDWQPRLPEPAKAAA
jgi:transposase